MFAFSSTLFLVFICITCQRGAASSSAESGDSSTTATSTSTTTVTTTTMFDCVDGCQTDQSHLDEYFKSRKIVQRLEYLKQQLISHLGIDRFPKDAPKLDPLPEFLVEQILYQQQSQNAIDMDEIEIRSRRTRKKQTIVFAEEETSNCYYLAKNSFCLKFRLTEDVLMADISSASIWLSEDHIFFNGVSAHNFTVIDLDSHNRRKYRRKCSMRENGEWCENNVTDVFKSLKMSKNKKEITLVVICDTCSNNVTIKKEQRIREKDKRPFLLFNAEIEKNSRSKRGVDCVPGNNECCRENLEIDFSKLGDYNMVVYPSKFNAYMCRGNCYYHSAATAEKPYADLMVMLKVNNTNKYSLPTSCCTPTRFSELPVIYAGGNSTYHSRRIPNMIVESCGCI